MDRPKFRTVRSLVALCLIITLVSTSLVVIPSTSYGMTPYEESDATTIDRVVLDAKMSSQSEVADHIWVATHHTNNLNSNHSVSYSSEYNAAKLTTSRNKTGYYQIGGFTPALETNISLEVLLPSFGFTFSSFTIYWYGYRIGFDNLNNKVDTIVTWYNSTGSIKTTVVRTPEYGVNNIPWLTIDISWHSNSEFYYSISDPNNVIQSGYNRTMQHYAFNDMPTLHPSMIWAEFYPSSNMPYNTDYSIYIRNLTQTIPVAESAAYADIPTKKYSAWGFDYPTISGLDAIEYLVERNCSATIFYDTGRLDDLWNASDMQYHLDNGMEFGIHLDTMATYDATYISSLNENFTLLLNMANTYGWNDASFAWTSLGNNYNYQYNDYVYNNYDSVGRKFWAHPYTNQGGLDYHYMTAVLTAIQKGMPVTGYLHTVGPDPTMATELSVSEFSDLVNLTQQTGVEIVGYMEYYSRYSAPETVELSISANAYSRTVSYEMVDLNPKNAIELTAKLSLMGFEDQEITVDNIRVLDEGNNEVAYTLVNDELKWDASEGELYTIVSQSEYREVMIDNAISPLFAIIPLVIILSVVPVVMGLGRKLK